MGWRRQSDTGEHRAFDDEVLRQLALIHSLDGRGASHPIALGIRLVRGDPDLAGSLGPEIARACKRLRRQRLVRALSYGDVEITQKGLAYVRALEIDGIMQNAISDERALSARTRGANLRRNRFAEAVAVFEGELAAVSNDEIVAMDETVAIDAHGHETLLDFVRQNEVLGDFAPAESQSFREALGATWSPRNGGWADETLTAQKLAAVAIFALAVEHLDPAERAELPITIPAWLFERPHDPPGL